MKMRVKPAAATLLLLVGIVLACTKKEAQVGTTGAAVGGGAGVAASFYAVKGVIFITPRKGFGDWNPTKVLQMDGETVARELPAEHQLIMDGTLPKLQLGEKELVDNGRLVYMPEKDRVLLVATRARETVAREAVVMFSNDHGSTWSAPKWLHTNAEGKPDASSDAAVTYLGDGKLIQSAWFSDDYGETWGVRGVPPSSYYGSPVVPFGSCLVDRDPKTGKLKRLLATGSTYLAAGAEPIKGEPASTAKRWDTVRALLRASYDGGLTWTDEIAPPSWNDGTSEVIVSENTLCRARNGTIVAAFRAPQHEYFGKVDHSSGLGVSLSKDNGLTWSKIKVLYKYGRHHMSTVLMPNGDLVMSYVVRLGWAGPKERLLDADGCPQWSIEAIVSRDNGETWDLAHRYVLAKWSGQSHAYMTSTIAFPDGSLLTAFGAGYRVRPTKELPWQGPVDVGLVHWRPYSVGSK